jgi:hypothetical protein
MENQKTVIEVGTTNSTSDKEIQRKYERKSLKSK